MIRASVPGAVLAPGSPTFGRAGYHSRVEIIVHAWFEEGAMEAAVGLERDTICCRSLAVGHLSGRRWLERFRDSANPDDCFRAPHRNRYGAQSRRYHADERPLFWNGRRVELKAATKPGA